MSGGVRASRKTMKRTGGSFPGSQSRWEDANLGPLLANTRLGSFGGTSPTGRAKRRQNSLCIAKDDF